jgi:hypothetical protein
METLRSSITIGGRVFTAELLGELQQLVEQEPGVAAGSLARVVCHRLAWYSPNGQMALSSAGHAVRKLRQRGVLPPAPRQTRSRGPNRLKGSGQPLPPVVGVPAKVDQVRGLYLHLLSGSDDPLHPLWNDLICQQHPCGDKPMAGPSLRYLIGSDHGWLGAIRMGPAAFQLASRDIWIGWSPQARQSNLNQVLGLSRFLIRREVRCANLASKVLRLLREQVVAHWLERYGVEPLLMETFVERDRFTGGCFGASNWQRLGVSSGRGRLGPKEPVCTPKDIWVYPLHIQARQRLQRESPPPLLPRGLEQSLAQADWVAEELGTLDLNDARLERRAQAILAARFAQPQASFFGSFGSWTPAKGAYGFIEQKEQRVSFESLLGAHAQATMARMAAEPCVLLPQDTTTLNYTGLKQTTGLGPIGEAKGRGLWLHSLMAVRPDGIPLGLLDGLCWSRPEASQEPQPGRNAKSLDQKESSRWVHMLQSAAQAARRMPQTQVVILTDREGDLYEMYDAAQIGPANLHTVIRAQHNRQLEDSEQKLWDFMAAQPLAGRREITLPRAPGRPVRTAQVELRFSPVTIQAPAVGCKKGWPALRIHAVWVREIDPPEGIEALNWMLLSDLPVATAAEAWERLQWYQRRWLIEEWHRALKTGCNAEGREFKTAEALKRVLAFDMIVAWRVLACIKIGRAMPQLPASLLYTEDELAMLQALSKKTRLPSASPKPMPSSHNSVALAHDAAMASRASKASPLASADSMT